jgi:hypothetical protein
MGVVVEPQLGEKEKGGERIIDELSVLSLRKEA